MMTTLIDITKMIPESEIVTKSFLSKQKVDIISEVREMFDDFSRGIHQEIESQRVHFEKECERYVKGAIEQMKDEMRLYHETVSSIKKKVEDYEDRLVTAGF